MKSYGGVKHKLTFKSLPQVMKELGHTQIDLLKFDIEGSEWELFETQVLNANMALPRQLSFELHAEGASKHFIPKELVRGKNRTVVNKLFLKLFDLGYRVLQMEYNIGNYNCAEFSMVLIA